MSHLRVIHYMDVPTLRRVTVAVDENSYPRYEIRVIKDGDILIGFRVNIQEDASLPLQRVEHTPLFLLPFVIRAFDKQVHKGTPFGVGAIKSIEPWEGEPEFVNHTLLADVLTRCDQGARLGSYYDVERRHMIHVDDGPWDSVRYGQEVRLRAGRLSPDEYQFRERMPVVISEDDVTRAILTIQRARRTAWEQARRGRLWENRQAAERTRLDPLEAERTRNLNRRFDV